MSRFQPVEAQPPGTTRPIIYSANAKPYGATPLKYVSGQAGRVPTIESVQASEVALAHHWLARCGCEFLGTFLLVFIVACCPAGPWLPTAVGATYIGLAYTIGLVSGAQLNPAISMAAFVAGRMPLKFFIGYVISQTLGGLLGGLFFRGLFSVASLAIPIMPVAPFHLLEATIVEIIYTTMLAFVALSVTCSTTNNRNQFYGVAIGFVIVAGGYVALKVSGALFNPAISLGLTASCLKLESFISGLWYALGELCCGILAALLFRICRHNEYSLGYETVYEAEYGTQEIPVMLPPSLPCRVFSEFLGTFWVVVTAVLNIVLCTGAMAWSLAGALISLLYALGSVAGAYFNPAVTLTIALSGRGVCSKKEGLWFAVAQLLSAIPAGLIGTIGRPALRDFANTTSAGTLPSHVSANATITGDIGLFVDYSRYNFLQIGIVELIFTFLVCYVVLVVLTSDMHVTSPSKPWPNFYYALAIGFVVCGACAAASNTSGGYLNPALVLGLEIEAQPSITSSLMLQNWPAFAVDIMRFFVIVFKGICYYARCFYYWIPELVGAGLAAAMFRVTHAMEYSGKDTYY